MPKQHIARALATEAAEVGTAAFRSGRWQIWKMGIETPTTTRWQYTASSHLVRATPLELIRSLGNRSCTHMAMATEQQRTRPRQTFSMVSMSLRSASRPSKGPNTIGPNWQNLR